MNVGDRISELRKSEGITQQQLANRIDVSKSAVGGYEQNRKKPSISVLNRISEYFGVTTDYLLGNSNLKHDPHSRIKEALEDEPELLGFWQEMRDRPELKELFIESEQLNDEAIKSIVEVVKQTKQSTRGVSNAN